MGLIKFIVAVDFDGTIVRDKFPAEGELIEGAKEALIALKRMGGYIIMWSSRNNPDAQLAALEKGDFQPLERMKQFLEKNGVPYDEIDDGRNGKIPADFYIDDHSVPDWSYLGWQGVVKWIGRKISAKDWISVIDKLSL